MTTNLAPSHRSIEALTSLKAGSRIGTSIVLPVGYMDQPTGLLHMEDGYVAGRGGGYSDNLLRRLSG